MKNQKWYEKNSSIINAILNMESDFLYEEILNLINSKQQTGKEDKEKIENFIKDIKEILSSFVEDIKIELEEKNIEIVKEDTKMKEIIEKLLKEDEEIKKEWEKVKYKLYKIILKHITPKQNYLEKLKEIKENMEIYLGKNVFIGIIVVLIIIPIIILLSSINSSNNSSIPEDIDSLYKQIKVYLTKDGILNTTLKRWRKLNWKEQKKLAQIYQKWYSLKTGLPIEKKIWIKRIKFEFSLIPPGIYYMGSPPDEKGRYGWEKMHKVKISKPFYLKKYEVTQEQWQIIMEKNPSYFKKSGPKAPVENISKDKCNTYIYHLNNITGEKIELPTEGEWEWACRSGVYGMSYEGDFEILESHKAPKLEELAWYKGNSGVEYKRNEEDEEEETKKKNKKYNCTHEVGKKRPNAFGLYDMLGNVWEMCQDNYDKYYGLSKKKINKNIMVIDPKSRRGVDYIVKGGSCLNGAEDCRAARRDEIDDDKDYYDVGFRLKLVINKN